MTRKTKIILSLSCLFVLIGVSIITVMKCKGRYLHVVYGYPTENALRLKQKGHFVLDGCVDSNQSNRVCAGGHPDKQTNPNDLQNIIFLGHKISYATKDLSQQFAKICSEDSNLIYDSLTQNVTMYGTTFHLNYHTKERGFMLISSVQPDTKQMRKVIMAISNYHGKERLDEPNNYLWCPELNDSMMINSYYPYIRLRRVHSDEGGTVIIVK